MAFPQKQNTFAAGFFDDPAPPPAPSGAGNAELRPQDAQLLKTLAFYHLRHGVTHEAVGLLVAARNLWPKDKSIVLGLAKALLDASQDSAADAILQEVARHSPHSFNSAEALMLRATLLLRKSKLLQARQLFAQIIGHGRR